MIESTSMLYNDFSLTKVMKGSSILSDECQVLNHSKFALLNQKNPTICNILGTFIFMLNENFRDNT